MGVYDGVHVEGAAWIRERARDLEPDIFAGLEMRCVETCDFHLDGSARGDGQIGHWSTGNSRDCGACLSRSGRGGRLCQCAIKDENVKVADTRM